MITFVLGQVLWGIFRSASAPKLAKGLFIVDYGKKKMYTFELTDKFLSTEEKEVFSNKLLSGIINFFDIPFFLWIKLGCGMDMGSNPEFMKYRDDSEEVFTVMSDYLKKKSILTLINDYTENFELYRTASVLPALPHGLIDTSKMSYFLWSKYPIFPRLFNILLKTTKIEGNEQMKFRVDNKEVTKHH